MLNHLVVSVGENGFNVLISMLKHLVVSVC